MRYVTSFERIGEKRGKEIGKEIGRKQGELNKALEIAKAMLMKNYSLEEILRLTGISQQALNGLVSK